MTVCINCHSDRRASVRGLLCGENRRFFPFRVPEPPLCDVCWTHFVKTLGGMTPAEAEKEWPEMVGFLLRLKPRRKRKEMT